LMLTRSSVSLEETSALCLSPLRRSPFVVIEIWRTPFSGQSPIISSRSPWNRGSPGPNSLMR